MSKHGSDVLGIIQPFGYRRNQLIQGELFILRDGMEALHGDVMPPEG